MLRPRNDPLRRIAAKGSMAHNYHGSAALGSTDRVYTGVEMNSFDESFRPIVICTIVLGLTIIAMLDFIGSTVATLNPDAARHAVSGFRLAYFSFTFFMLLLGLVYVGNNLFSRRIRVTINFLASIIFFYVFSIIGEVFGALFESLPGLSEGGFTGSALNAVMAVVSLPIATASLVAVLLLGKGVRHIHTNLSARRTETSDDPPT